MTISNVFKILSFTLVCALGVADVFAMEHKEPNRGQKRKTMSESSDAAVSVGAATDDLPEAPPAKRAKTSAEGKDAATANATPAVSGLGLGGLEGDVEMPQAKESGAGSGAFPGSGAAPLGGSEIKGLDEANYIAEVFCIASADGLKVLINLDMLFAMSTTMMRMLQGNNSALTKTEIAKTIFGDSKGPEKNAGIIFSSGKVLQLFTLFLGAMEKYTRNNTMLLTPDEFNKVLTHVTANASLLDIVHVMKIANYLGISLLMQVCAQFLLRQNEANVMIIEKSKAVNNAFLLEDKAGEFHNARVNFLEVLFSQATEQERAELSELLDNDCLHFLIVELAYKTNTNVGKYIVFFEEHFYFLPARKIGLGNKDEGDAQQQMRSLMNMVCQVPQCITMLPPSIVEYLKEQVPLSNDAALFEAIIDVIQKNILNPTFDFNRWFNLLPQEDGWRGRVGKILQDIQKELLGDNPEYIAKRVVEHFPGVDEKKDVEFNKANTLMRNINYYQQDFLKRHEAFSGIRDEIKTIMQELLRTNDVQNILVDDIRSRLPEAFKIQDELVIRCIMFGIFKNGLCLRIEYSDTFPSCVIL